MAFRPPDPEHFWLDLDEAARRLGIKADKFRELWQAGMLPDPGLWINSQTHYWSTDTVDALGVLLGFIVGLFVEPPVKSKRPPKSGPKAGPTEGEPR